MSKIIPQKILLFITLFLCSIVGTAQHVITGTVLDEKNNPIEFATVSLIDTITKQLVTGMITDEKGQFRLETDETGFFQLSIQFLGYEKWQRILAENSDLDLGVITLLGNTNNLAEALVVAEKPVIERKEDQLVFNIASSTLNTGYDGIEVLEQAPFVWIDQDDNIQMRNQNARILINGRPLNLGGADLASYIRNLRSENIKSIEIQTTPSANSDASNQGGIINIILKKKVVGFNSNIRVSQQLYGEGFYRFNPNMSFNYGAEKWNFYGGYFYRGLKTNAKLNTDISYLSSNDYLATDILSSNRSKPHNYQLGAVFAPWKDHEFGMEFFGSTSSRRIETEGDLSFTNLQDTIDRGVTINVNNIKRNVNSVILNYTWHLDTLNSKFIVIADRTRQNNNDNNNAISTYEIGWFTDNELRNVFENQTDISSLQLDYIKYTKSGWKAELGAKISRTERDNKLLAEDKIGDVWLNTDRSANLNYQENITAAYANTSKTFAKKHFVKVGLRMENTDLNRIDFINPDTITKNYTDFFPSAYYAYDFAKGGNLSINYSRRLSRPAFYELNNDVRKVNDFRYSKGNPDLRPEYIDLYEVKVQKKKQTVSVYYRQANDAINGVYTLEEDSIAIYQRQNNGAQKQMGIEYVISHDVTRWWSTRAATHFYNRKYTNDDGEDSFKRSTFSLRLFNTFIINKSTSIDLNIRYQTKTEDAFYIQDEFYYTNIILKKSFWNKKLNCRIYLNDIFNTFRTGNTRPFDEIITTRTRKPRSQSISFWLSYNFSTKTKWNKRKNNTKNDLRNRL